MDKTWHLAENADEIEITEFELQLWRVFFGFVRWQEGCEKNANARSLTGNEVAILHAIRMKDRAKTIADIETLLNRHDTHNIRYSINKLLKMKLIEQVPSTYSKKNHSFQITEAGINDTDQYTKMRRSIIIKLFQDSTLNLGDIIKALTKIKTIYDEADRMVSATSLL